MYACTNTCKYKFHFEFGHFCQHSVLTGVAKDSDAALGCMPSHQSVM